MELAGNVPTWHQAWHPGIGRETCENEKKLKQFKRKSQPRPLGLMIISHSVVALAALIVEDLIVNAVIFALTNSTNVIAYVSV
jgi:hypothetical protein